MGALTAFQVRASEPYPVSPMVSAVKVERVGDVLFRYVEFFELYPCLRLETLKPTKRRLITRKDLCRFRTGGLHIDTRKDVAAVFFRNFALRDDAFHFDVDLSLRRAGAPYLNCVVTIGNNGALSEPQCSEGNRPSE